jgi:hypothetical protein
MTLNPASGQNFLLGARVLQQNNRHSDSGASYLVAMRLGIPAGHGDLAEARYAHLLDTIRRRRDFGNVVRPQLEKRIVNDQQHRYPHMWDPRKVLDDGQRTTGGSPDKPELELRFQGTRELHFAWQEPYDGGDEIYEYILHAADYDCKWQEKTNSFFDGFRPWRVVHQGPAAVREFKYKGLKPANQYQFRLVARNSCGSSDECEKLFETARLGQPGKVGDEGVPKSWLKVDLGDIMASYVESSGRSVLQFVQEISGEIGRFVGKLRLIFKLYCPMGRNELDPITFRKFMKDCGLIKGQPSLLDKGGAPSERRASSKNLAAAGDGGSPAGGGATADGRRLFEVGCKPLAPGEVDLLFQRATTSGLQSRSKKFAESQELAGDIKDQVDNIAEMLTEGMDREGKDEDNPEDDEDNFMQIKEFVGALVRVAWTALPHCKGDNPYDTHWGMGARLGRLLDQVVMPAMEEILNKSDPLARVLERGRVRAVLEHYDKDLHAIFSAWAAADQQTTEARQSADSVNLPEFLFLLNQGKLIDANLTLAQATSIFAFVNMQSEQEEGGDEDMGELVYDEFVQVIARCCDAKIPEANRGGEAFEYTLQTWLEYQVVPIYRALIKDRKRGIAKATL